MAVRGSQCWHKIDRRARFTNEMSGVRTSPRGGEDDQNRVRLLIRSEKTTDPRLGGFLDYTWRASSWTPSHQQSPSLDLAESSRLVGVVLLLNAHSKHRCFSTLGSLVRFIDTQVNIICFSRDASWWCMTLHVMEAGVSVVTSLFMDCPVRVHVCFELKRMLHRHSFRNNKTLSS